MKRARKEPPDPHEIVAFVETQPNCRHHLGMVADHFGVEVTEAKLGKPLYNSWTRVLMRARQMIEEKRGVKFKFTWESRNKVYQLP